jgi:hypothetical protein
MSAEICGETAAELAPKSTAKFPAPILQTETGADVAPVDQIKVQKPMAVGSKGNGSP